jgi:hypothetical protein
MKVRKILASCRLNLKLNFGKLWKDTTASVMINTFCQTLREFSIAGRETMIASLSYSLTPQSLN